ncbi:MAG: response regulator transcription factor [Pirellulales bacterium]
MRLLIVEDEPDLLKILAKSLREDGFAVDTAEAGNEGLHKALAYDYDLLILDWMLPEISGIDLLTSLRRKKATPVLLLTARDSIADRVHGLDQGADDYLIKPFNISELLARVRALIRRSHQLTTNAVQIGELNIDLAAKQVFRNEDLVVLTAREFSILELLVVNRGKLVSRTTICNHIFDENDDSFSNSIDVHVSHIRKKLGFSLIETRRGLGYILDG